MHLRRLGGDGSTVCVVDRRDHRHLVPQSRVRRAWSALSLPVALLAGTVVGVVASNTLAVGFIAGLLTFGLLIALIRWVERRWDSVTALTDFSPDLLIEIPQL
jgi:hypothetical protein